MSEENFCKFKEKDCTQIPKIYLEENRTVWSHLVGLTCKNPSDPNYLEAKNDLFLNSSAEQLAKNWSDIEPIGHSCFYCRKRLEGVLGFCKLT